VLQTRRCRSTDTSSPLFLFLLGSPAHYSSYTFHPFSFFLLCIHPFTFLQCHNCLKSFSPHVRISEFCERLATMAAGQTPFTLIMTDPLSNRFYFLCCLTVLATVCTLKRLALLNLFIHFSFLLFLWCVAALSTILLPLSQIRN
jgi:hypothetical protein